MDTLIEELHKRLQDELSITELADGSGVLLDLQGHQVLALNATGLHLVLRIRTTPASAEELATGLAAEFVVGSDDALRDTRAFLATIAELLGHDRTG